MPRNDLQNKAYPGGIKNRIDGITMRTAGNVSTVYTDARTGQVGTSGTLQYEGGPGPSGVDGTYNYDLAASGFWDPRGIKKQTSAEPPVERSRSHYTKNTDI